MRKFSALTVPHSVLGLHHGIPGCCPTRNFNLDVLTFQKFLNGELMKRGATKREVMKREVMMREVMKRELMKRELMKRKVMKIER